jgi:uncharacterized protein (TIGR03437 family)
MERQRKLFIAKTALILGVIPVVIWAYETGPDAGYCGVPGENPSCVSAGCHTGTANDKNNKGSVAVTFPNGLSYVPGVKQHLTVTISDPAPTQAAWGFQLTARASNNPKTQAGTFASTDQYTGIECAEASNIANESAVLNLPNQTCPAAMTLQYIEHNVMGYTHTIGQGSGSYQFDWTPPSTNIGNIVVYVAGNAGVAGPPNANGDHIYTTTYTLTPATAGGPTPTVTKVVSASGFGGFSAIAPGQWIEISGSNLATDTRIWTGNDFSGVTAPTSLDGTKVTIGGQQAFTYYISDTQVNALVPSNVATGSQQLTVTNGSTSAAFPVTVNALEPGLLALPQSPWLVGSKQYVVAQTCDAGKKCVLATDLTFILPTGTSIPGYPVRPAKPGETLTIYGIGFGPAIDSSNLSVPVGQIVTVANQLVDQVQMQVNGVPATLSYAGFAPSQVGLYQFNLVVPTVPDGDWPLTFTQNGTKGTQTLLLSVHQ